MDKTYMEYPFATIMGEYITLNQFVMENMVGTNTYGVLHYDAEGTKIGIELKSGKKNEAYTIAMTHSGSGRIRARTFLKAMSYELEKRKKYLVYERGEMLIIDLAGNEKKNVIFKKFIAKNCHTEFPYVTVNNYNLNFNQVAVRMFLKNAPYGVFIVDRKKKKIKIELVKTNNRDSNRIYPTRDKYCQVFNKEILDLLNPGRNKKSKYILYKEGKYIVFGY